MPRGGTRDSSAWRNFGITPAGISGIGTPNATWTTYDTAPGTGYYFYLYGTYGATAWYPCASFREPDAYIKFTGQSSLLWTTTRKDDARMHDLYFYPDGVRCWGGDPNSYGNPIRCIRE